MRGWVALVLLVGACGEPDEGEPDSSGEGGAECQSDSDCDDGVFCNGVERCDPNASEAGSRGCMSSGPACPSMGCDESTDECDASCPDEDGDGSANAACGGDDCDDANANVYPGNTEVCDPANLDEDCDPRTFGFRDSDSDGFPDANCCNGDLCGTDCDDAQPAVHPSEAESCDGLDNDCDSLVDEGVLRTFYIDADGDTFGDPDGARLESCSPPAGYVENDGDCNDDPDGGAAINPLAAELCDPGCMPDGSGCVDENCDGAPNTDCSCVAGSVDECEEAGACRAGTRICAADGVWGACSITPEVEVCDGIDNDCDGPRDEGLSATCFRDVDNDGYAALVEATQQCPDASRVDVGMCPLGYTGREPLAGDIDCDDSDFSRRPGRTEVCVAGIEPVDDDCDGSIDEGVSVMCFTDADNDTFPPPEAIAMARCRNEDRPDWGFCPPGTTAYHAQIDCDDENANVNPGEFELCNGTLDDNCSGEIDEGCTCTLMPIETQSCALPGVCGSGTQTCLPDGEGGTMWGACSESGSAESCDGEDDDCDGNTDEGTLTSCWADADGDGYAALGAEMLQVCGACGAGFTETEPAGADVDCNDDPAMNGAGAHPGATEICDGWDNDCDAGGGMWQDEDVDGDGFTAIGYEGCVGGFPKTDCHDENGDVHPDQTEFFANGYCPPGTHSSASCPPGTCRLMFACSALESFDYDCSGSETPQPVVSGCNTGASNGCAIAPCPNVVGPGELESSDDCGELVTPWLACQCGGDFECAFVTLGRGGTLKCR